MATLHPLAPEPSARLLSVVSSFSGQLVANKGASPKVVKRCMEDVQEVLEEEGTRLPKDVRQLLDSALSSLSPSASSLQPLSFSSCTRALSLLASALSRLAEPPAPPAPSPISRLPAELVAHIVSFCQVDDLRLRQNTNLALASTCWAFNHAAQPILDSEAHLFTPGQLERVTQRVREIGGDDIGITTLTADLALHDIKRQADGRWPGGGVNTILSELSGRTPRLRVLKFLLRPTNKYDGHGDELEAALGFNEFDFTYFFGGNQHYPFLEELHVPSPDDSPAASVVGAALFEPPRRIRSLCIGHTAYPNPVEAEDLQDMMAKHHHKISKARQKGAMRHLHTLAIPWFEFRPQDFLPFVDGSSGAPVPPLRHLEVTFVIKDMVEDLAVVKAIFALVAPTLRRLAIRIISASETEWHTLEDEYVAGAVAAFEQLLHLQHLEVDGQPIESILTHSYFPHLRHLVLLPRAIFSHLGASPSHFIDSLSLGIKSIVVCIPTDLKPTRAAGWDEREFRHCIEAAEREQIELKLEERQQEYNLLQW